MATGGIVLDRVDDPGMVAGAFRELIVALPGGRKVEITAITVPCAEEPEAENEASTDADLVGAALEILKKASVSGAVILKG